MLHKPYFIHLYLEFQVVFKLKAIVKIFNFPHFLCKIHQIQLNTQIE
jgi:hypothetical protein